MTPAHEGHVVTLTDFYNELREQRDLLIEIKTTLSAIPDHESRLRKLETLVWRAAGAAAALGAVGGFMGTKLFGA